MIFNMILPMQGSAPVKIQDPHTLLLIHGDKIEDASMYQVQLTNSGATISAETHFPGAKSLVFNGNAKIEFPQQAIIWGSKPFTVDWWELSKGNTTGCRFTSSAFTEADVNKKGMMIGSDGKLFRISTTGSAFRYEAKNFFSNTEGAWVHWACVRRMGKVTSYRNGVKFAELGVPDSEEVFQGGSFPQAIGAQRGDMPYFNFKGLIQEFRISDVARWTADFTPPDKPYDNIPVPEPENLATVTEATVSFDSTAGRNAVAGGVMAKVQAGKKYRVKLHYDIEVVEKWGSSEASDFRLGSYEYWHQVACFGRKWGIGIGKESKDVDVILDCFKDDQTGTGNRLMLVDTTGVRGTIHIFGLEVTEVTA